MISVCEAKVFTRAVGTTRPEFLGFRRDSFCWRGPWLGRLGAILRMTYVTTWYVTGGGQKTDRRYLRTGAGPGCVGEGQIGEIGRIGPVRVGRVPAWDDYRVLTHTLTTPSYRSNATFRSRTPGLKLRGSVYVYPCITVYVLFIAHARASRI